MRQLYVLALQEVAYIYHIPRSYSAPVIYMEAFCACKNMVASVASALFIYTK
jgi:hypothetical protein